jgi:hypothetical protein
MATAIVTFASLAFDQSRAKVDKGKSGNDCNQRQKFIFL